MTEDTEPAAPEEPESVSRLDDTRSVTLHSASGVFRRTPSLERAAAALENDSTSGVDPASEDQGDSSSRFPHDPLDSTVAAEAHSEDLEAIEPRTEEPRIKRARRFKALDVRKRIKEISESRRISAEAVAWALEDNDALDTETAEAFPRPPEVPSEPVTPGDEAGTELRSAEFRGSELWRVRSSQSSLRLASDVPMNARPSSHGARTYSQSSVYSQNFGSLDIEDYWELEEDETSGTPKRSAETRSVTVKRPSSVFKALTDTQAAKVVEGPDPKASKRMIAQIAQDAAKEQAAPTRRKRRPRRGRRRKDEPEENPRLMLSLALLALVLVLVVGGVVLFGGSDPVTGSEARPGRRKVKGSTSQVFAAVGDQDQTYTLPLQSGFSASISASGSVSQQGGKGTKQRLLLRERELSERERLDAISDLWVTAAQEGKVFTAAVQLAGLGQRGVDAFADYLVRIRPGEAEAGLAMELLASLEAEAESRAWVRLLRDSRGSLARVVEARVTERGELTTLEGCLEAIVMSSAPTLPKAQRAATVALLDRFGVSGALDLAGEAEPDRARLLYGVVIAVDPRRMAPLLEEALRDPKRREWALDILRFSRGPVVLEPLHEILSRARDGQLIRVCRVLGAFGASASVPHLLERRSSCSERERGHVDASLRAIARARSGQSDWQGWWSEAEPDLGNLEKLCEGTRLTTRPTRSRLIDLQRALRLAGPEVEQLALDLLTDPDPVLREAAVRACARLRIAAAAPRLARGLSSPDRDAAQSALEALRAITGWSELGDDPAVWRKALRLESGGR